MTTTSSLSSMLQAYTRQAQQRASATTNAAATASTKAADATTSATGSRNDSVNLSPEAIQALLKAEGQNSSGSIADIGAAKTPEEAARAAQLSLMRMQQGFLTGDWSGSSGSGSGGDNLTSLMDSYIQGLDAQISSSIAAAQERMTAQADTAGKSG